LVNLCIEFLFVLLHNQSLTCTQIIYFSSLSCISLTYIVWVIPVVIFLPSDSLYYSIHFLCKPPLSISVLSYKYTNNKSSQFSQQCLLEISSSLLLTCFIIPCVKLFSLRHSALADYGSESHNAYIPSNYVQLQKL